MGLPPTAPQYPPAPQPIADGSNAFRVTREWLLFFATLARQAAAGSGAATNPSPGGAAFTLMGLDSEGGDPFGSFSAIPGPPGPAGPTGVPGVPGMEGEPGDEGTIWMLTQSSGSGISADYVLMSNGANPPTPMDDGAGNFLYVGYAA